MGVIKKSSISQPISDSIEDVLEEIQDEENDQEPVIRRPRKSKHRPARPHAIGGTNITNAKSGKKKKRVDNSNYLLSLAEPDEYQELSIQDFIPQTVSVFSQMFIHRDSIEIWHEFINCTKNNEEWFRKNISVEESDVTGCTNEPNCDPRSNHPAYIASKYFQKIDGDLRLMLKKKHVPLGTLMHLEQELVTFFINRPNSIYHCHIPNSYERLMIHALSQYMDLSSLSYNRSGARWTRVRNKHDNFYLPSILLSSHLERRYNNTVN